MNERLDEYFYYKLGDYYAVPKGNDQTKTSLFDSEGNYLVAKKLYLNLNEYEQVGRDYDSNFLSKRFGKDKIQTIYEELKKIFLQYKTKSEGEYWSSSVTVIGRILRLSYEYYIEKDDDEIDMCYVDFFSVNDDGTLELVPKRRKTQNNR